MASYNPYRKPSVQNIMATRERGGPQMSYVTDPVSGQRLTNEQAAAAGPYSFSLSGSAGGRGARIGSAAGALGSEGTPTSQRGRLEKFGSLDAAAMPTYKAAQIAKNSIFSGGLKDLYNMATRNQFLPPKGVTMGTQTVMSGGAGGAQQRPPGVGALPPPSVQNGTNTFTSTTLAPGPPAQTSPIPAVGLGSPIVMGTSIVGGPQPPAPMGFVPPGGSVLSMRPGQTLLPNSNNLPALNALFKNLLKKP